MVISPFNQKNRRWHFFHSWHFLHPAFCLLLWSSCSGDLDTSNTNTQEGAGGLGNQTTASRDGSGAKGKSDSRADLSAAALADAGIYTGDGKTNSASKTDAAGTPPSTGAYGKVCTDSSQCAHGEICFKKAPDNYHSSEPPAKGLCLKTCRQTNTACQMSSSGFYPCINSSTWDLGAVTVCAIACEAGPPFISPALSNGACPNAAQCNITIVSQGPLIICGPIY